MEEKKYSIGLVQGIGERAVQQDDYGYSNPDQAEELHAGMLLVLADGMGGMSGGEKASAAVVDSCGEFFSKSGDRVLDSEGLKEMLEAANTAVRERLGRLAGKGGSTAVVVTVYGDSAYWATVGDSHIYLYREHVLMCLNREHNYATMLDELVRQGKISEKDAKSHPRRQALTSCVGEERIAEIDYNETPLTLSSGDKLMLASDGIFRTMSETDLEECLMYGAEEAARMIGERVQEKAEPRQDNYTALILERL